VSEGPEHVTELDFGCIPDPSGSREFLLQDESSAYLTFHAVRRGSDGYFHDAGLAVVEMPFCHITRFGYPNDEALEGHPLWDKGLGAYGIYEVLNSSWKAQLAEQNLVCFPNPHPDAGARSRHYVFTFHESTFECIAEGLTLTVIQEGTEGIHAELLGRLMRGGPSARYVRERGGKPAPGEP
jgi:hypothetical protein